jgi:acetyl esterase/lipase
MKLSSSISSEGIYSVRTVIGPSFGANRANADVALCNRAWPKPFASAVSRKSRGAGPDRHPDFIKNHDGFCICDRRNEMSLPYRGMDRAALDKAYNNVKAVPDFAAILSDFQARSAAVYENNPCDRNIPYGKSDRECVDLVHGFSADAPTVIYLHGGYWQTLRKEDFAFVANGPLAHGYNVAMAEYSLAPQVSMTQIIQEVGRLLDYIAANRDELGIGGGPVALVGHSAGGHLSLVHRSHPLLTHTMAISPLVDLEPISLSWLNEKLGLSPSEINLYSPLRHIVKGTPMTIAVGATELPELLRHASEYAATAETSGERVDYQLIAGSNHFSVLEELARADGALTIALAHVLSR